MKEDLRVVKTKRALKEALKELLQQENFEKLTVSKICDKALVNRVTFYTHYQDKFDLFQECLDDISKEVTDVSGIITDGSSVEENLTIYCKHIAYNVIDICLENKAIISTFNDQGNSMLVYMIEREAIKYLTELYSETKKFISPKFDNDFAIPFIVGGTSKAIYEWIESGKEIDVDKFKREISEISDSITSTGVFFEKKMI